MSAFPKGDCEDDYIVHVIDMAAKHLGYNNIKELQWKVIKEVIKGSDVFELPLCFDPKFLRIFGISVIFNPHAIQNTGFMVSVETEEAILYKYACADSFLID